MHYYQHNIGDFDKATRHLTRIERSVYRDLIELYYDCEGQISLDINYLCRKILAKTPEEVTAVEQTLNEFFAETPTGWYHDRCEEEIERYKTSASQKAAAGRASAAARKEKRQRALNARIADVERASNGTPTIQEPSNTIQEPLNNLKDIVDSGESPVADNAYLEKMFDIFWKHYQVKQGKQTAKKKFMQLLKGKTEFMARYAKDMILSYYMHCLESNILGFDKLHPTTYLSQKRWTDDPEFIKEFKAQWMKDNANG